MGRLASGLTALAIASVACAAVPTRAQSLATLHVRRFSINADQTSVRAGEFFHLTMTAHVDEPVAQLDNVTLPDLAGMDVSGDERRCSATPRGSDCSETLTLAATLPGDRTLGPWTMDAIDAHNRRASRFSSNTVVVHVMGPSPLQGIGGTLRDLALAALSALGGFALAGAATWFVLRALARRRAARAIAMVPAVVAAPPPAPSRASLHELIEALAREPTRPRAVAVRDALRERFGAREDETYADLVARRAIVDDEALAAYRAVERASFCEDERVADAAREALPFLTR